MFSVSSGLETSAAEAQDSSPRERALRLYGQASEDYRSGHFEQAAARLREAYALYPEPVLLYNLARALEGSGALREARDAYQRYLAEAPRDAEERQPSEVRIAVIDGLLARLEPQDAQPAHAEPEPHASTTRAEASSSPDRTAGLAGGLTLSVLGALTLGAGIGLGVHAVSLDDRAHTSGSHAVGEPLHLEASDYATAANVSFVVGAALGLVGLTWTIVELSNGGATESARVLLLTPSLGGLEISGRF